MHSHTSQTELEAPRRGGAVRFVVLAAVVFGVLGSSVLVLFYAIAKTGKKDYQGPDKIVYPEHRYYR